MMYLDPAHSITQICGGLTIVARTLNVAINTPVRWRNPTEKGGTGGVIPRKYHDRLIALAAERGVDLPRGAFADPELAQALLQRHREAAAAA